MKVLLLTEHILEFQGRVWHNSDNLIFRLYSYGKFQLKIWLFSIKITNQTWYISRFQWHCSWFVVAGLAWLIVCDNHSLNTFNYRLSLVIWLIYCLQGILSESISKILPIIKKLNTHLTCCIAYLVIGLINILAFVFYIHSVYWDITPSKTPLPPFCEAPN